MDKTLLSGSYDNYLDAVLPDVPEDAPGAEGLSPRTKAETAPARETAAARRSPTVYEKLEAARADVASTVIKKSGRNAYANYSYHELTDFLPQCIKAARQRKITPVFSFGTEAATLSVVDAEKPEDRIKFSIPVRIQMQKSQNPMQSIGSAITYARRYLYMMAFDIAENDSIDSQDPSNFSDRQSESQDQQASAPNDCNSFRDQAVPPLEEQVQRFPEPEETGPAVQSGESAAQERTAPATPMSQDKRMLLLKGVSARIKTDIEFKKKVAAELQREGTHRMSEMSDEALKRLADE